MTNDQRDEMIAILRSIETKIRRGRADSEISTAERAVLARLSESIGLFLIRDRAEALSAAETMAALTSYLNEVETQYNLSDHAQG
jgi:hypothetical protein